MPASPIDQELAVLRAHAQSGNYDADLIVRTFDAMRATNKTIQRVRAATTANRTLSGLTNTVLDGYTPLENERILVKSQTVGAENGLYKAHAGAWTRLVDDNGDYVLITGMLVVIERGSTLQDTMWELTTDTFVVGTDALVFSQFGSSLGAGTLTTGQLAIIDGQGIGPAILVKKVFAAGAGGSADDVAIFSANAPYGFRIVDVFAIITTAVGGASVTLRTAAGGGGSALSDALSAATTGYKRNTALAASVTIAANGTVSLRRSDSGVAGEVYMMIIKE